MNAPSSTLTFQLQSPSGLLLKLRHDITRLHRPHSTDDVRFAALDCAIDALHMVDWLLQHVTDERHEELCGVKRHQHGAVKGFIELNAERIPDLAICDLLANSAKHRVLRRKVIPSVETSTTVRFDPPFDATREDEPRHYDIYSVAIIQGGDKPEDAIDFFKRLERNWRSILVDEGHLSPKLEHAEIELE